MIAWLANQFRMAMCKHQLTFNEPEVIDVQAEDATVPLGKLIVQRCPNCGFVLTQKVKW